MINDVVRLVRDMGGLAATARALGHKHMSTVQGWRDTGRIPTWRREVVSAAAAAMGLDPRSYSCLQGAAGEVESPRNRDQPANLIGGGMGATALPLTPTNPRSTP